MSGTVTEPSVARTIFHIGANKAGSTTLQRALFARHKDVLSLGKPAPAPEALCVIEAIRRACDRLGEGSLPHETERLSQLWRQAVAPAADGRVPVFSHEEMIRDQYYGEPDPERFPRAIASITGPLRVVIVTRHQLQLIESLYIHKANMTAFLAPHQWFESDRGEHFVYGYRFHEIADAWARVVGEENVGVFLFEELVNDSAAFAKRLCDFIGIDADLGAKLLLSQHENVRKSKRTQAYVRLRARLFPAVSFGQLLPAALRGRWRSYLDGGPRAKVKLPSEWVHRIEEHYRSDNRKLAERFGLPLQTYDYPM